MSELNEFKGTVGKVQTAQLVVCNTLLEILIDKSVISAEEAAQRFRDAAERAARSDSGLIGAEIVGCIVEFLEDRYPGLRKDPRPS